LGPASLRSTYRACDNSAPEPDLAVVPRDHGAGHPRSAFLLVEAADSSLRKDRLVKAPLYAATGVQEYWILDLDARSIEVLRDPSPSGFRSVERHGPGDTIPLEAFPDVRVAVSDVLPPAGARARTKAKKRRSRSKKKVTSPRNGPMSRLGQALLPSLLAA